MLPTQLAPALLALAGLTISVCKYAWDVLVEKGSQLSSLLHFWRVDVNEAPLTSGARPDTTFPVFDKTPGDDPFVRDAFREALLKLARQHMGPVDVQRYSCKLLNMAYDDADGDAMIPRHERHSPAQSPADSFSGQGNSSSPSDRWVHGRSTTGGPGAMSSSLFGTSSVGRSERPAKAGRLSRQKAFRGAWDPATFFNDAWWINPLDESASSSGPVLEHWMSSVRIVKRSSSRMKYGATDTPGPEDVAANWRARFRLTFPDFDILEPGEDTSQSTRWPGYNA